MKEISYLIKDVKRMLGKNKYRLFYIWISRPFVGVFSYRLERFFFTFLGKYYKYIRILFLPLINIAQAYSNIDINYKAQIKGGIRILHPSVGCVVSEFSIIGKNLTMSGGNVIGVKKRCLQGEFTIGDNCLMGANATIIGPLNLGDNVNIGAMSCVVKSNLRGNCILAGIPAIEINN